MSDDTSDANEQAIHPPDPDALADAEGTVGRSSERYASPGSVQEVIDAAATNDYSRVRLYPETTYRPASTWEVKPGVTLDYNGAHVTLAFDSDVHHVHPGGQVLRPIVDLTNVNGSYSSSVFVFDSQQYGFYGNNPSWLVRGGITRGRTGEGTVFEFVQGGENAIYFVHADHAVWNTGTVVEMHRGDAFGINGNRIHGLWYGFERGIHMYNRTTPDRAVDNISGNHFDVIAQPKDSKILWDMEAGHFNMIQGRLWDFANYSDVMWRIHQTDAMQRFGNVLHWFPVGGTEESLLSGSGAPDVFDDRLGDPRNRVVVPWLQGHSVGEF